MRFYRISAVLFHTIAPAACKREKETKFSFSLLILSSFLAAVRRFLKESDTDMPLLPGYDEVDVSIFEVCCKFIFFCKNFRAPHPLALPERGAKIGAPLTWKIGE